MIDSSFNIDEYVEKLKKYDYTDPSLYAKYDVKRGLRDEKGRGVVTGLTSISAVEGRREVDGNTEYIDGILSYRGYKVNDLIRGAYDDKRFGFEEVVYLLLFGELPDREELEKFSKLLTDVRALPENFLSDFLLRSTNPDIMNVLARSVLTLHSYDDLPNDVSIQNVLRQSIYLISVFPMLAIYAYRAHRHFDCDESLYIHRPDPAKSVAENILLMLRPDQKYTDFEARVLDMCLIVHAEHGGGNNSSFTTHVVTSTGTDTYSAIAAAVSSLKGPKHGGANIKAVKMMDDIKAHVSDPRDDDEITAYLNKILRGEAYDHAGLLYGVGHAIYTKSDPRTEILRTFIRTLAEEKGCADDFDLYTRVERLAPIVVTGGRNVVKPICANVDFYSGFVYRMLGLPYEMYTPLFACARIPGWCAHRLEELISGGKIIRPAYVNIGKSEIYRSLNER